jgi:DNA-binding response OmpR family regulator
MRALIVDDDELIRETLVSLFEDHGVEVFAASSAEDALRVLETMTIDVAVVDMRLPGIDGNECILLAHSLNRNLRFLILTGLGGYVAPPSLQALGISQALVFRKPLSDMTRLLETALRLGQV